MRIERLDLLRFGKFTDRRIALPSAPVDLHFVVGANEAGKSTIRAAITDLLFGIETQSPYDFVHAYADMRLGAVLARGDVLLEFMRLKRTKNPLRDPEDKPLDDTLLAPLLGGIERASFERMFCLDHEGLVKGGDDILKAKDDIARLLFEASSGIGSFGRLRDALEEEAKGLWDKRKSGDRAYYRAAEELREADVLLGDATVRAKDWAAAGDRVKEAQAAVDAGWSALKERDTLRANLERVRRVAPHLNKLRADRALLREITGAVRLPPTAQADLTHAQQAIAQADALLTNIAAAETVLARQLSEIVLDEVCVAVSADITALAERATRTRDFEGDIRNARIELDARLEELRQVASQLGWSGDEQALEQMAPALITQAGLRELIEAHAELSASQTGASQARAEKQSELDLLAPQLAALNGAVTSPHQHAALESARALGDVGKRIDSATSSFTRAREKLDREVQTLAPWSGTLEQLRSLALPAEEEARAHAAHEQQLMTRLQVSREAARESRAEAESLRLQIAQSRQQSGLVTQAELLEARRARDALWTRIRDKSIALDAAASDFEAQTREADRRADVRYAGASSVAAFEEREAQIARQELKVAQLDSAAAALEAEVTAHRAVWAQRMQTAALGVVTASQFADWRRNRESVLTLAEAVSTSEAELADLQKSLERAGQDLRSVLLGSVLPADASFAQLLSHATDAARRADEQAAQRKLLLEQHARAKIAFESQNKREADARAAMSSWEERWKQQLTAVRLPPDTGRLAAKQALALFASLADTLKSIRDLRRNRIDVMQRELDAFASAAERVSHSLSESPTPGLQLLAPTQLARDLVQRLEKAQSAAARATLLQDQLQRRRTEKTQALERKEQANALIRPLMDLCGAGTLVELNEAIQRSDRLHRAELALDESTRACLESGDGCSIEQLESQIDAEEISTIPARLQALTAEVEQLREAQAARDQHLAACRVQMDKHGGQADAAAAESKRQQALASMSESVERYIRVTIAARLLRWSIDRYREEKQGPLLKRAGQLFQTLTRGSFDRLTVDEGDKQPVLRGSRADGKGVDVSGMSDGTRDQLFLSLRLAALELQLAQGMALPFVADDLFINFDDARAAAGFKALAELATRTQVIFLTHHDHLQKVAEQAIGAPLNCVQL